MKKLQQAKGPRLVSKTVAHVDSKGAYDSRRSLNVGFEHYGLNVNTYGASVLLPNTLAKQRQQQIGDPKSITSRTTRMDRYLLYFAITGWRMPSIQ